MKIVQFVGSSGSGKTTLIKLLIPEFQMRGVDVSTIKFARRDFDADVPGKDSFIHRQAGAKEVLVMSENRWVLMHEKAEADDFALADLIQHMTPIDILLIEGFCAHDVDMIEVHRPTVSRALHCSKVRRIIAIASDSALSSATVPVLDINSPLDVSGFLVNHWKKKQDESALAVRSEKFRNGFETIF